MTLSAAVPQPPARVGRHGEALARFERSGGRTILRDSFFRVPLQIIRPLYPEGGDPAHLMLINPTGGHVGGDRLDTEVVLGAGARVLWTTQGAAKIYRSLGEAVVSALSVRLEAGAGLEMLPDPIIPYRGAIYRQRTQVELAEGAKLIYGESVYHGRVASGEWFDYTSLALRFEAYWEGTPLLTDAMEIRPSQAAPERLGLFEPYPYLGSFYVLGGDEKALDSAAQAVDAFMAEGEGLAGGASRLAGPGFIVRWLAASPGRLRGSYGEVWNMARKALFGVEAVRLRKF